MTVFSHGNELCLYPRPILSVLTNGRIYTYLKGSYSEAERNNALSPPLQARFRMHRPLMLLSGFIPVF